MTEGAGNDAEEHWSIEYAGRAEKDIARLDPPMRRRVLTALGELAADPGSVQPRKLKGAHEWTVERRTRGSAI